MKKPPCRAYEDRSPLDVQRPKRPSLGVVGEPAAEFKNELQKYMNLQKALVSRDRVKPPSMLCNTLS